MGDAVEREVAGLHDALAGGADAGTKDLRSLLWSSIDNATSKDLDQIEVAEQLADKGIVLRIGIADVDALVPKGSAIDAHAFANATSVYTGVHVYPMLPEELSTGLTSLNEGAEPARARHRGRARARRHGAASRRLPRASRRTARSWRTRRSARGSRGAGPSRRSPSRTTRSRGSSGCRITRRVSSSACASRRAPSSSTRSKRRRSAKDGKIE